MQKVLTTRHALLLIIAFLVGMAAGGLVWFATLSMPLAILAGGAAFPPAWTFFDRLVG